LLITGTPVSTAWLKLPRWTRYAIIATVAVCGAVIFYYFFNSSYSFRFSFVPLVGDRFTVDGYTLFSSDHLLDNLSLLFLLFPGVLLAVGGIFSEVGRQQLRLREFVFLWVLVISTLGATFVFASGLGMARDWDLFSFGGVPLVIAGYLLLLRLRRYMRGATLATTLAILLGFFSLIPRVLGQAVPPIGLQQVYQYAMLDPHKSLYVLRQLDQHFREQGIPERSPLLNFDYRKQYPEYGLVLSGIQLRMQGQSLRALPEFEKAIEKNPSFAPAYANLGSCYLELDQVDSALAYLHIACGMRPHEVETLTDLGRAYLKKGEAERGRQYLNRALELNNEFLPASLALLEHYLAEGADRQYYDLLLRMAQGDQAPASVYKQAGDYYLARQSIDSAAAVYRRALDRGLDPAELNGVVQNHPELAPLIQ
jgi:tetratricopeptide (TPR) repeat protein